MIVKNAAATGRCEAMKDIIELQADDLYDGESNGQ